MRFAPPKKPIYFSLLLAAAKLLGDFVSGLLQIVFPVSQVPLQNLVLVPLDYIGLLLVAIGIYWYARTYRRTFSFNESASIALIMSVLIFILPILPAVVLNIGQQQHGESFATLLFFYVIAKAISGVINFFVFWLMLEWLPRWCVTKKHAK